MQIQDDKRRDEGRVGICVDKISNNMTTITRERLSGALDWGGVSRRERSRGADLRHPSLPPQPFLMDVVILFAAFPGCLFFYVRE